MFYRVDTHRLILFVRLIPKSSVDSVIKVEDRDDGKQHLIIRLRAIPENNKANKALIKFLAKQWKIPSSCILLGSGATSQYKQLYFSKYLKEIEQILQSFRNYDPIEKSKK
ncbi:MULTISPECIES: DUF167 domain-containing protein [unclassified Bartonella]|uniref:DUF167 domain-containing protein n=1 Tax=unclassified Bartonella TaxID=2645622 RepID=UPI00099A3A95|nr:MULTISPECIES: DUF167 family protein [unclassified Bartonella]AQX28354.1 hypothetical protein BJB15x_009640 [Bartonella sp. JB15]AQX29621.1 hypothetical protein BJB63x_009500 [Bartonella sp. JB63]